jgi:hypothetical protein
MRPLWPWKIRKIRAEFASGKNTEKTFLTALCRDEASCCATWPSPTGVPRCPACRAGVGVTRRENKPSEKNTTYCNSHRGRASCMGGLNHRRSGLVHLNSYYYINRARGPLCFATHLKQPPKKEKIETFDPRVPQRVSRS